MTSQLPAHKYSSALVIDSDSLSLRIVARALRENGIQRIDSADSLQAAATHLGSMPDLLITEVVIGQEACFPLLEALATTENRPTIVGMSRTASRTQVFRLSAYGVKAFLEKPVSSTALSRAIYSAGNWTQMDWQRVAPQARSAAVVEQFVKARRRAWDLTSAEQEILRYACTGMSRQEIAAERGVSINTVKTHVRSILNKAGMSSMRLILRQVAELGSVDGVGRAAGPDAELRA